MLSGLPAGPVAFWGWEGAPGPHNTAVSSCAPPVPVLIPPPSPIRRMLRHPWHHSGTGHSRATHWDLMSEAPAEQRDLGCLGPGSVPSPEPPWEGLGTGSGSRDLPQPHALGLPPNAMTSSHGFKATEMGLCCPSHTACKIWRVAGHTASLVPCPRAGFGWVAVAEPSPRGLGWQLLGCPWWVLP